MLTQSGLDALWDLEDPAGSEARLRTAQAHADSTQEQDELATQVARTLGLQGRFPEGHAILDTVDRTDGVVDVRAALERGRLHQYAGNATAALPLFLHAAENASRLGLSFLEVEALHAAATVDRTDAEEWSAHALRVLDAVPDAALQRWRVAVLYSLGWCRFDRGHFVAAMTTFEQAKEAADRWGSPAERANTAQAIMECRQLIASDERAGRVALRLPSRRGDEHVDVLITGGRFAMGDAFDEADPGDGATPVHEVHLGSFRMDAAPVTNAQFSHFIAATGYRTDAETFGSSAVFHTLVRAPATAILGAATGAPWWISVAGADWGHPFGPDSHWHDLADHPVVHVSHRDALAYCVWSGRRLPTEAEWEYAARGGAHGARYPWGDELLGADQTWPANLFQGVFPDHDTAEDGFARTSPVGAFPANAFGLFDVIGNVWEWCADWFAVHSYASSTMRNPTGPSNGELRVMRGGSYLSSPSQGVSDRVSARSASTPDSSAGNCGFRTVTAA